MSDQEIQNLLRRLPAVGALIEELRRRLPEESGTDTELLTYLARRRIADRRSALLEGSGQGEVVDPAVDLDGLADELARDLAAWRRGSSTCRVVNATGILLHSGLGRAVLPPAALDAVARADGYVLLEVDRRDGKRRKRDAFLEELLCHLTGAEAALVVNNNAAATILILASMAAGKNVVVSRSQMVEIGGSYRLPDVMEASGCLLREVGTTNRSYGEDYEGAVDEQTGALLLVHTSNYRLVGFTRHVEIREMVEIGRRVGKPVIHDLGSGCLVDAAALGLRHLALGEEPPVRESVAAGADVICFSGDKILGGAQAGIVVGKKEWIERIRKHPLARAMRIDKLTCIALEAVLKLYLEPSKLVERIPTLTMLEESPESVAERARTLAERLRRELGEGVEVELVEATSEMGAGSLPAVGISTTCVAVRSAGSADELARQLRERPVPIFARIQDGAMLFDARTLRRDPRDGSADVAEIVAALGEILTAS